MLRCSFHPFQGIDPAAEGLAEEDASNSRSSGSTVAGAPPRDLVNSFRSRGVQGSIAIGNLAELLESEDELTRFTTAKVLHRHPLYPFKGLYLQISLVMDTVLKDLNKLSYPTLWFDLSPLL